MRIGISLKWTLSAVLIVILVVTVYAFFTNKDTQESVDRETDRIRRIQYEALDQLGAQTTKTLSLPASSLMFDNDLAGLKGLIDPIISNTGTTNGASYSAVYATIIAPEGRVWVTSVNDNIAKLSMADTQFYDKTRDDKSVEKVSRAFLKESTKDNAPQDVTRQVVTNTNETIDMPIRQYAVPIRARNADDNEQPQGYIVIGYSIEGLEKEIRMIRDQGEMRKSESLERSIFLALLAILIGGLISGIQSIMITHNIKRLTHAANQIASGDLSVRSTIRSHDEIAQLSDQFNVMADRVQQLMAETEQKAMLEKEVDIARSIQTTLLPPAGYAECGRISLNGFFQPASTCGGDFWSYNLLPDHSVLLTIGDVTGHGVPSAMITACAKSSLDTILHMQNQQIINIAKLLEELNIAICQAAKRTLFMTFQAILISPDGRHAEVGNAGHNFPLLMRGSDVKALVVRGERLGDNPNAKYATARVDLAQNDMLLLYTDGLTEYQNMQNAEYGEKRLRKVLASSGSHDVNTAMQTLLNDFSAFCQGAPQHDDITLMFSRIG